MLAGQRAKPLELAVVELQQWFPSPVAQDELGGRCVHLLLGCATTSTTWDQGMIRRPRKRTPLSLITVLGNDAAMASAIHAAAKAKSPHWSLRRYCEIPRISQSTAKTAGNQRANPVPR